MNGEPVNVNGKVSPQAMELQATLDRMFEERNKRAARTQHRLDEAKAAKAQIVSFIDSTTAAANADDDRRVAELEAQITGMVEQKRPQIRRWFGRTIVLPSGVIKWRLIPRALDLPEDDSALIERLLKRPDGEEYLIKYYKLNKRKLASLSRWSQRRLGIRSLRQEHLTIKPAGDDKAVTLSKRRFPATPHIQD